MDSHGPGRADSPPAKMPHCVATKSNGQPCPQHATSGDVYCARHRKIADKRERDRRANEVWFEVLDYLWGPNGREIERADLVQIIGNAQVGRRIDLDSAFALYDRLEVEWRWYMELRPLPVVQPRSDLHALALDAQNVHTKAVTSQTTGTMEMLLNVPVPEDQKTLKEINMAWTGRRTTGVIADMRKWYRIKECREPDDRLYRRLLDCVWARIKLHEHRTELVERLWQECVDSKKMCCEGHLSRLCSVFVGFDADAKQEVSVGELLQQKIAAIAGKDTPVEHKVIDAWAVFEELKVPKEQRLAWIEAF